MSRFLSFSVIFFTFHFIHAQPFSTDREKFFKEVSKYIFLAGNEEVRDFVANFDRFVKHRIPQERFLKMVETCNKIHNKKLKPQPDFYNYVRSMYYIDEYKVDLENYVVWHNLLEENLEKNNVKYASEYLQSTSDFFERGALYTATNFEWIAKGGNYTLKKGPNGLEFYFSNTNLTCLTQIKGSKPLDSMALIGTSGVYDLDKNKWKGNSGTVTWEKVGLHKLQTYAELRNYEIAMRATQYRCDTVLLRTPYFDKPIMGNLIDRTWNVTREADRTFPQFNSFERRLYIPNIVPNINYTGGFMLQGASFVGVGTNTEKAIVEYNKGSKSVYRIETNEVNVDKKQLLVKQGRLSYFLGDHDSLTHEMVRCVYRPDQGSTEFMRDKVGLGVAPFNSSYHQLDFYADRIIWNDGEKDLFFRWHEGAAEEQRYCKIESRNFFNGMQYDRIGGNATKHPLVSLYNFVVKKGETTLTEGEAASALGGLVEQVKGLLLELAGGGFIAYDLEQKTVRVLTKTEQFVKSKANSIDYDNLIFESDLRPLKIEGKSAQEIQSTPELQRLQERYDKDNKANKALKEFAKLDLGSLDLEIYACRSVPISDRRNTQVFPKGRTLVVQKNRNFIFSGWVNVGKMELDVVSGFFDYNKFEIQVPNSTQAFLSVTPLKKEDGNRAITSQSYISGIKGEIKVDHPSNRSGAKEKTYSQYPTLISKAPSRVYYNDKSIQRGAYDSTRFYFEIAPFELDSLVAFNEKAMRLEGTMNTGGIFPEFQQKLKIMPDYSFGFSMEAPKNGFAFYGSESKYNNQILLSNSGLQGKGIIEYVTSKAESIGLFTFTPDSTIGFAKFTTEPREIATEMPDVKTDEAYITYVPSNNLLKAQTTKSPMNFFNDEAKFVGTVYVKPDGFKGSGKFNLPTAQVASGNYTATRWQILADTSNFNLRNMNNEPDEGNIAFASENVSCKVDFKARKGEFISNKGTSMIQFPVNQYLCQMDRFNWVMDVDEVELEKNPEATSDISIDTELGLAKSNFFSTHPKQDSLDFLSLKARFDYKTKTIYCNKVEYVDVADARIFPKNQSLIIRRKAVLDPLEDAEIVANYITKYHRFKKVDLNIYGKRSYAGSGEYEYVAIDGTTTNFFLKSITLDKNFQTIADGQIPSSANFKLSPHFDFHGKFGIRASFESIEFDGMTRINHECKEYGQNWIAFKGQVDAKNVMIPMDDEVKNENGLIVSSGIGWHVDVENEKAQMYPMFLSEMLSPNDQNLIIPKGVLTFNAEAQEYRFANKEKLENRNAPGTYLALHLPTCALNGDGLLNLGLNTPGVDVNAIGTINYDPRTKETAMNVTLKFNMVFEKSVLERVAEKMASMPNLPAISIDNIKQNTTLEQAFHSWGDTKIADKLLSDYALKKSSVKKMPIEYEATMIVTGVKLHSIDGIPQISGLSSGSKDACVVSFYREPVMRLIPVEVAFYKNEKGQDNFGLYMMITGWSNFFFQYQVNKKEGKLLVVTTDQDSRNKLASIKADKRKSKNYEYELSNNTALYQAFRQLLNQRP